MDLINIPAPSAAALGPRQSATAPQSGATAGGSSGFASIMQAQRASMPSEPTAGPGPEGSGSAPPSKKALSGADAQSREQGQKAGQSERDTTASDGASVPVVVSSAKSQARDGEVGGGRSNDRVNSDSIEAKDVPAVASLGKKENGKELPPILAALILPGSVFRAAAMAAADRPLRGEGAAATAITTFGPGGIPTGHSGGGVDGKMGNPQAVVDHNPSPTRSIQSESSETSARGSGEGVSIPSRELPQHSPDGAGTPSLAAAALVKTIARPSNPGFAVFSSIPSSKLSDALGPMVGTGPAGTMALPLPLSPAHSEPLPTPSVVPVPVSAQVAWGEALGQQMQWMLGQNLQQVTLQLHPAHLGPLVVRLDLHGNGEANAVFISAHAEVRAAIQVAIPQLQQSFAALGLQLGQASVDAGAGRQFSDGGRTRQTWTNRSVAVAEAPVSAPLAALQGLVNTFV